LGFKNELTGRDNAYLAGLLQGLTKIDAKQSLVPIEAFCELGDYFDEPVKTYSSGMLARLGFGTALLNRSSVILIDEVLGVGDAAFRAKAREALNQQLSEERSVVLVSHADIQIKRLCSRAIWLDAGGIEMSGDPQSVVDAYNAVKGP
jgi:lipopolysaccharide transport system ATP-binding protein